MKKLPTELETLTHCGYTEDMLDQLAKWCPIYSKEKDFATIQELLQQGDLKKLMENLKAAELYLPLMQFLTSHFSKELSGGKTVKKGVISNFCKEVCQEIESHKTLHHCPQTKRLLALIMEAYKAKGAAVENETDCVYSTLFGDSTWDKYRMKNALFRDEGKCSDSNFLMLIVMLDMPLELAEVFITKFLQRRSFQLWNLEELLAYLCVKESIRNPLAFCRKARDIYEQSPLDENTLNYQNTRDISFQLQQMMIQLEQDGAREIWDGQKIADAFCDFLKEYKIRTDGKAIHWFNEKKKPRLRKKAHGNPMEHGEWQVPVPVYHDCGKREFEKMRSALASELNRILEKEEKQKQDGLYQNIYEDAVIKMRAYFSEKGIDEKEYLDKMEGLYDAVSGVLKETMLTRVRLSTYRTKPNTGEKNDKQNKHSAVVRRCDMVTMAFLYECNGCVEKSEDWQQCSEYIDTWRKRSKYLSNQTLKRKWIDEILVQPINDKLIDCGYSPLYYANPYDCFIIYLLTCEQPFETYQLLWAMYMENEKRSKSK